LKRTKGHVGIANPEQVGIACLASKNLMNVTAMPSFGVALEFQMNAYVVIPLFEIAVLATFNTSIK